MDKFVIDYLHGTKVDNMSYYETGTTMCFLHYFL